MLENRHYSCKVFFKILLIYLNLSKYNFWSLKKKKTDYDAYDCYNNLYKNKFTLIFHKEGHHCNLIMLSALYNCIRNNGANLYLPYIEYFYTGSYHKKIFDTIINDKKKVRKKLIRTSKLYYGYNEKNKAESSLVSQKNFEVLKKNYLITNVLFDLIHNMCTLKLNQHKYNKSTCICLRFSKQKCSFAKYAIIDFNLKERYSLLKHIVATFCKQSVNTKHASAHQYLHKQIDGLKIGKRQMTPLYDILARSSYGKTLNQGGLISYLYNNVSFASNLECGLNFNFLKKTKNHRNYTYVNSPIFKYLGTALEKAKILAIKMEWAPVYSKTVVYYLLSFLENSLKTKIWVKIRTNAIIPTSINKMLIVASKKNVNDQKAVGKELFLLEMYQILWISLYTRNLEFFGIWLKNLMEKIHLKKHRKMIKVIFSTLKKNKKIFLQYSNSGGISIDIRGKLGVTGNAKKRHYAFTVGSVSITTKRKAMYYYFNTVRTDTGVLGLSYFMAEL